MTPNGAHTQHPRSIPFSRRVVIGALSLLYVCVMPGIAVLVPLGLALAEPSQQVDWSAAQHLPPISGDATPSAPLSLDTPREPKCVKGSCIARTTRPILEATVEPDPSNGYRFLVYDLSGSGGMTQVAAEAQSQSATWSPQPGLLRHGHVYLWTVFGDDPTSPQPMRSFTVDLLGAGKQATHRAGPISVGLSSGEMSLTIAPSEGLALEYRTADPSGRTAGATPRSALSDGWRMSGTALGDAPWARIETFGNGDIVVAYAMDGTAIRYEKDEEGRYRPPSVEGVDVSFSYPTLAEVTDNLFVIVESDGGTSRFDALGDLSSFTRTAVDGLADIALEVTWVNGRIVQARDTSTGRMAFFSYLGERNCPRPPPGFGGTHGSTPLCQVLYLDGVTSNVRPINFFYVDGSLARVVGDGGSTVDLGYDTSGRLVRLREAIGGDAVAAGVRADDAGVLWRIAYDALGRAAEVKSPSPTSGTSPLTFQYQYGEGSGSVTQVASGKADVSLVEVVYDPDGWQALEERRSGVDPTRYLYDEDGELIGIVGPNGLQTSWETDEHDNVVARWGPAPAAWFDANGRPLAAHAPKIATTTTGYNEDPDTQGLLGIFFDSVDPSASPVGIRLLNGANTAFPKTTAAGGARMLANGAIWLEDDVDTDWRLIAPNAAQGTTLTVAQAVCALGETCEIEAAEEPEGGQVVSIWINYLSDSALPPQSPPAFTVEKLTGGGAWAPVDTASIRTLDRPTSETTYDTFALGDAPSARTTRTFYDDPVLGSEGRIEVNGRVVSTMTYEDADHLADAFGRAKSVVLPSGLTTSIDYYGSNELAVDPMGGQPVPQSGGIRSIRVGSRPAFSRVYGDHGHVVGTFRGGETQSISEYDQRGRLLYREIEAGGDASLSPERAVEFFYGPNGDPLETRVVWSIGSQTLVETATTDLLGRVVSRVDSSGVLAETAYDTRGVAYLSTYKVRVGEHWQLVSRSTTEVNDHLLVVAVDVLDISGRVHRADVTSFDGAGRRTQVKYDQGTEREVQLDVTFDAVTGKLTGQVWTDAGGNTFADNTVRSTQTGRILRHTLSGPSGTATKQYTYDASTGFLTHASLDGTGEIPTASWEYGYAYDGHGASLCASHNTNAALDGSRTHRIETNASETVRLDYCYDENDAPVRLRERLVPNGGSATERDVPLELIDGAIVGFETAELKYDIDENLVEATDGDTTIQYVRDASGSVVEEVITKAGETTTRRTRQGGLLLDGDDQVVAQVFSLPGGVFVRVDAEDVVRSFSTQTGDRWWSAREDGRHDGGVVALFSPDGEPLTDALNTDPTDADSTLGWRTLDNGRTLGTETPLVMFGARLYVPKLGAFTTADPVPNGTMTPYVYADNDAINLADPDGMSTTQSDAEKILTNPWVELAITVVLTFAMVAAMATGNFALAAVFALMLFGYNTFLSVYWFMQGDHLLGVWYATQALISLAFFAGALRLKFMKANIVQKLKVKPSSGTRNSAGVRTQYELKLRTDLPGPTGADVPMGSPIGSADRLVANVHFQARTVRLYPLADGRTGLGIARHGFRSFPMRAWMDGVRILMHGATQSSRYLTTTFWTVHGLRAYGHIHAGGRYYTIHGTTGL